MKKQIYIVLLLSTLLSCTREAPIITAEELQVEIKEHREEYLNDFVKNPSSPIDSTAFKDLHFFDPDPAYYCECDFEKLAKPSAFKMSTYAGTVQDYMVYAKLKCPIMDTIINLELYRNIRLLSMPQYKNYAFLPFRDETNGEQTYGGGRYMDIKLDTSVQAKIIIDFNKAYNPYCAYSDGYACPIPPIANHISLPIRAGELAYTGPKATRDK